MPIYPAPQYSREDIVPESTAGGVADILGGLGQGLQGVGAGIQNYKTRQLENQKTQLIKQILAKISANKQPTQPVNPNASQILSPNMTPMQPMSPMVASTNPMNGLPSAPATVPSSQGQDIWNDPEIMNAASALGLYGNTEILDTMNKRMQIQKSELETQKLTEQLKTDALKEKREPWYFSVATGYNKEKLPGTYLIYQTPTYVSEHQTRFAQIKRAMGDRTRALSQKDRDKITAIDNNYKKQATDYEDAIKNIDIAYNTAKQIRPTLKNFMGIKRPTSGLLSKLALSGNPDATAFMVSRPAILGAIKKLKIQTTGTNPSKLFDLDNSDQETDDAAYNILSTNLGSAYKSLITKREHAKAQISDFYTIPKDFQDVFKYAHDHNMTYDEVMLARARVIEKKQEEQRRALLLQMAAQPDNQEQPAPEE